MSNERQTNVAEPLALGLSDQLGPLQKPRYSSKFLQLFGLNNPEDAYTTDQVRTMLAAERERWHKAATAALEVLDDLPAWSNAAHACHLLRDALKA